MYLIQYQKEAFLNANYITKILWKNGDIQVCTREHTKYPLIVAPEYHDAFLHTLQYHSNVANIASIFAKLKRGEA